MWEDEDITTIANAYCATGALITLIPAISPRRRWQILRLLVIATANLIVRTTFGSLSWIHLLIIGCIVKGMIGVDSPVNFSFIYFK